VTCHRCGEMGHYANEIAKCKAATEKGPEKLSGVTATTVNGEEVYEKYEESDPSMSFEFCGCHIESNFFIYVRTARKCLTHGFCLTINQQLIKKKLFQGIKEK